MVCIKGILPNLNFTFCIEDVNVLVLRRQSMTKQESEVLEKFANEKVKSAKLFRVWH